MVNILQKLTRSSRRFKTDKKDFLYIEIPNPNYCDKHETDFIREFYVFYEVVDPKNEPALEAKSHLYKEKIAETI